MLKICDDLEHVNGVSEVVKWVFTSSNNFVGSFEPPQNSCDDSYHGMIPEFT